MDNDTNLPLFFKYVRLALTRMRKTGAVQVSEEMLDIQKELSLTHEQILESVFAILLDDEQDHCKEKQKS